MQAPSGSAVWSRLGLPHLPRGLGSLERDCRARGLGQSWQLLLSPGGREETRARRAPPVIFKGPLGSLSSGRWQAGFPACQLNFELASTRWQP